MPGLLRGMARTAVIAGTATTVSNRVSRRQAQPLGEPGPGRARRRRAPSRRRSSTRRRPRRRRSGEDRITQLKELAALKDQGVLSEEEFAAEKAKILAG